MAGGTGPCGATAPTPGVADRGDQSAPSQRHRRGIGSPAVLTRQPLGVLLPRLYNVDHQPAVIDHDHPAVLPGEAHEFTATEAARLTGAWSKDDPRRGLAAEKTFKRKRDAQAQPSPAKPLADIDPAVPEKE